MVHIIGDLLQEFVDKGKTHCYNTCMNKGVLSMGILLEVRLF